MAYPQGIFYYPGIRGVKSGEYTCLHGINPGRILLRATAQDLPPSETGDLTIVYGSGRWVIRDCKVVDIKTTQNDRGFESEYTIEDHRWRWRFGEIEGHYNRRLPDGSIEPSSFRTTQELATLLFKAMKTPAYDVSQLPETGFPEVEWVSQNPARELESLAAEFGCRVVYDPISHTTRLLKAGQGEPLPKSPIYVSGAIAAVTPAVPSSIRVVGDVTRVEGRVKLKAVGREADGVVKEIDDLVDKPTNGWGQEPFTFPNVYLTNKASHKSYLETVWKWYRVDLENNPITIQADGFQFVINDIDKIEELSLDLNDKFQDPVTNELIRRGYVDGIFYDSASDGANGVPTNTSFFKNDMRLKRSFSLDPKDKTVKFSEPVFKVSDNATAANYEWEPAELELTCTFAIRNSGLTNSLHRFSYTQAAGGDPSKIGAKVVLAEDLVWKVTDQNKPTKNSSAYGLAPNWKTNRVDAKLDAESISRIQAEREKYNDLLTGDAYYAGVIPARLDGAIQSVTWRFSKLGTFTEIFRNTEPDYIQSKYDRRFEVNEIRRKLNLP